MKRWCLLFVFVSTFAFAADTPEIYHLVLKNPTSPLVKQTRTKKNKSWFQPQLHRLHLTPSQKDQLVSELPPHAILLHCTRTPKPPKSNALEHDRTQPLVIDTKKPGRHIAITRSGVEREHENPTKQGMQIEQQIAEIVAHRNDIKVTDPNKPQFELRIFEELTKPERDAVSKLLKKKYASDSQFTSLVKKTKLLLQRSREGYVQIR